MIVQQDNFGSQIRTNSAHAKGAGSTFAGQRILFMPDLRVLADCRSFRGDSVDGELSWDGAGTRASLSAVPSGVNASIRFVLQDADFMPST